MLLAVFFIWLLWINVSKNTGQLVAIKNSTVELQMQNDEIERFKKNYNTYKPNLDAIEKLFVDPRNPVDFIEFLEDTAASSNLQFYVSLAKDAKLEANGIGFRISVSGNFFDIVRFTNNMEHGPYLISIKTVTLGQLSGKDEATQLSGNIDANFLIQVFTSI
ncbi:MAG: hypothetical protein A3D44_03750 [Candidatus Staskawiczbacteria bacterium RIFCSPHIGHO2_02_FULL_42_22]|uniref:Uncharacterized protein n=1 Tax=Candidatus Staskawiczbacteria bacterium RIFCSPHIGHO2_02_FULL_42_22 TaxID=1802207 RepID=A0A1G2I402_9BACT|nr:MAG: hypothetical protein A3D44_03750 [Candidatus Staskawiczbacteria bacterium RIFCSPHIGHO2_02_FULL_42_22]